MAETRPYGRIMALLGKTHNIMLNATRHMAQRGNDLEVAEQRSIDVLNTSQLFMFKTIPWYERLYIRLKRTCCICPAWWFHFGPSTH
jgi:hypothetical protein